MKRIFFLAIIFLSPYLSPAQDVTQVSEVQMFNSFKQDLVKFDGFWSKFGGGGNCASIAVIKAAIGTFGINGVFKSVITDEANKVINVTLRNGNVEKISFDRLNNGKSRFFITKIGNDEVSKQIAEYARLCFAVMIRSKQIQMGNDTKYWYKASDKLNKGQYGGDIYMLLGLQKEDITDLSINNLRSYKNLVVWISPHAVYSSSGNYDEFFRGTDTGIEPLSRLNEFHCKTCPILGAYTLK